MSGIVHHSFKIAFTFYLSFDLNAMFKLVELVFTDEVLELGKVRDLPKGYTLWVTWGPKKSLCLQIKDTVPEPRLPLFNAYMILLS